MRGLLLSGCVLAALLCVSCAPPRDPELELHSRMQSVQGEMWLVYSEIGGDLPDETLLANLLTAVHARGVSAACPTDGTPLRFNPDISVWRGEASESKRIEIIAGCVHGETYLAIYGDMTVGRLSAEELPDWYANAVTGKP